MHDVKPGTERNIGHLLPVLLFFLFLFPAASPHKNSPNELVDVRDVDSTIVLDLRYATANNFTHHVLYPVARCMLRRIVAESLSAAQRELRPLGLGLKIFDAYRPLSVQKKLWAAVPDDRYVANPSKGSRHNRGAAVDLTLVDSHGHELSMPTPFDDFTVRAHCDFTNLPEAELKNRALLERVMTNHGFLTMRTEWWHFDFQHWGRYGILDMPLR
ncbi:MAG TPA: D-alanyl-D-alanine dipeptidase [Bacteroidota bacterium]|nr:D-alanyl-D-alanine dipeptidase [Bacteroidota bacterium]